MRKTLLLLLALGILLTSAACSAEAETEGPAAATAEQAPYVEAYGVVQSTDARNITLEFQAPVAKVHVREGERVRAGQKLVTLDLTEIRSQLGNKELELQAARNEIGTSLSSANPELKKLQNDLNNARAVYEKDRTELAKKQSLYDAGSISQSELEAAKKLADGDKKAVDDASYAIESLKNSKGIQKDQKSLQSSVAEADLNLLKNRLGKPYINDPDIVSDIPNGLVYDISYTAGDIAGPEKKLLSILDLDKLIVRADVPEEFIKGVKIGADVDVVPTADKSRHYKGKVAYISGKAVSNNGETLVSVEISLDRPDDFLLPGYNVDVRITNQ